MGKKGMTGVTVIYNDGGTKTYKCSGYRSQFWKFEGSAKAEPALLLFYGKNKKPKPFRQSKIKTWHAVYEE
jgi:hypothetical protein